MGNVEKGYFLSVSTQAVLSTLAALPRGAFNRPLDHFTAAMNDPTLSTPREPHEKYLSEHQRALTRGYQRWGEAAVCTYDVRLATLSIFEKKQIALDDIGRLAQEAMSGGCGNCAEHAAVAFGFLLGCRLRAPPELKFPLDFMQLAGGDHNFVVVGRKDESTPASFETWGEDAVVCDAWAKRAFPAAEFRAKKVGGDHAVICRYRYPP